jgi:hypothetical protein
MPTAGCARSGGPSPDFSWGLMAAADDRLAGFWSRILVTAALEQPRGRYLASAPSAAPTGPTPACGPSASGLGGAQILHPLNPARG